MMMSIIELSKIHDKTRISLLPSPSVPDVLLAIRLGCLKASSQVAGYLPEGEGGKALLLPGEGWG